MDKKTKEKILEVYGSPAIKIKGKDNKPVFLTFARQTQDDVNEIEKMTNKELVDRWKSLVWMNDIFGQVSLNDLQRICLIEAEMDTRESINKDELKAWYDEKIKEHEAEEEMAEKERNSENGV